VYKNIFLYTHSAPLAHTRYPKVLCNERYHICKSTVIMASANIVQVEKLEGRENFAT